MEKEKKFLNLSAAYRNYLNEIDKILLNYDITKSYNFKEINSFYDQINNINNKLLIVEKDIDNLFNNYLKSNDTINKMKHLLKYRNTEIIRNILRSDQYKIYVQKLHNEYKKDIKKIENALLDIIKKYSMSWKCCWSFIDIDSHGNVKKIELFDINDIKSFKEKIKYDT
jgi:hypothetical protein